LLKATAFQLGGEFLTKSVTWQRTATMHVGDVEARLPSPTGDIKCTGKVVLFYFIVVIYITSHIGRTVALVLLDTELM